MPARKAIEVLCVVLCTWVGTAAAADAQGATALGDPMHGTSGLIMEIGAGAEAHDDSASERDPDPMAPAGLGLKLGVGFVPTMSLKSPLTGSVGSSQIGARTGLYLAVPIHFGDGSGIAFDLEPFLFRYARQAEREGADDHALEVGGYAGPAVRFHMQHFYLSLGIGAKVGWIMDDQLDVGMDLFGRVPITATYYVSDSVGMTFELGLAYGATGVKAKVDPLTGVTTGGGAALTGAAIAAEAASVQYGRGFAMDSSIGLRFP